MTGPSEAVQARLCAVQKYRLRVESLRLEAQTIEERERQRVLLFIADNYEELANSIEAASSSPDS